MKGARHRASMRGAWLVNTEQSQTTLMAGKLHRTAGMHTLQGSKGSARQGFPKMHLRVPVAEGASLDILPAEPHVVACT
jgi:hypothetical protein